MSLAVENLKVYYRTLRGDVKALDGATFGVADGEIMGLAGESGCGKSTLGKSLIRLDGRMRYVEGRVELDGQELPIWDTERMNPFRFKQVSIVPQYAMSAINPTRKIGQDGRGSCSHSRGETLRDDPAGARAAPRPGRPAARRPDDVSRSSSRAG